MPAGAYVARYAKAPRDAPPSKRELLGAIRDSWFSIHRALVSIGLFFAFVGAMLSYSAVEDENAGHMGCAHAYYGVATLLAAAHPRLAALVGADVSDVSDVSDALGSDFFERPSLLAHACRGGETASHTNPFAW